MKLRCLWVIELIFLLLLSSNISAKKLKFYDRIAAEFEKELADKTSYENYRVTNDQVMVLSKLLRHNKKIIKLNISGGVHFDDSGAEALALMIEKNTAIKFLNLSNKFH